MPHLDELARLSVDPRIPVGERWDANAEIFETFRSGVTPALVSEIRDDIHRALLQEHQLKAAVHLAPYWYKSTPPASHPRHHTSVLYVNEYGLVDQGKSRWVEKRGITGFDFLRDVRNSVDIIGAIIMTRVRQVVRFLDPERDRSPEGFHFARVDGQKLTDADMPAIRDLELKILNCGDIGDYFERQKYRRDDLIGFATKVVTDTLTGDACPIELTRTNGGKLSGWHSMDFTSVRLTVESGYEGDDEIRALQLIEGIPHVAFGYEDILYEIRNPRTDIASGGYGCAEPEMFIRALTHYLNAISYNAAGIDSSAVPRGILTLLGKYSPEQLKVADRLLRGMLSGAGNRHTYPIFASEEKGTGAVWTPIDQFDEMFFARWITLVVSIACACYGIDPGEIHFDSFAIRPSTLSGDNTKEKLALSRDKGLVPLLGFLKKVLNIFVTLINPKYRLEFVGLDEEDQAQKQERLMGSSTINEIREMDGKDPMENELLGNAPSDPAYLGLYMQTAVQSGELQPVEAEAGERDDARADWKPPRRARPSPDDDALAKAAVLIERGVAL